NHGQGHLVIFAVHNEHRHGVFFLRSSVKSVSENALVLSYAFFAPAACSTARIDLECLATPSRQSDWRHNKRSQAACSTATGRPRRRHGSRQRLPSAAPRDWLASAA